MAKSIKGISLSLFLLTILSANTLFAAFDSAKFNKQNGAIKVIGITPQALMSRRRARSGRATTSTG